MCGENVSYAQFLFYDVKSAFELMEVHNISAKELSINEEIRIKEVRVVSDNGEQLGVMSSAEALDKAYAKGLDLVLIAPPNASEDTIKTICSKSKGYTYVVSRFGITGTDSESGYPVEVIESVKMNNGPAPVLGFGISKPEHVKSAIKAGAKGAISGSAIVKIIANNLDNTDKMKSEISDFIKAMKEATKQ